MGTDNLKINTRPSVYSDDLTILFTLSKDLLCLIDVHGLIQKVSRSFAVETGYTESELISKPFTEFIYPDDVDQFFRLMQTAQNHQINFSSRFILKNNHPQILDWKLIKNSAGQFFLCAQSKEVLLATEPEPTTEISISERRFKTLVQSSSELLSISTQEGFITYISPTVTSILGYDPSFYTGKNAFDFVHPDDVKILYPIFSNIGNNYKMELPHYRFIDSNGKWHWLETTITNLLHNPDIQGILINAKDITARKEIEAEKFDLSRRFNSLVENNKDIFFTLSRNWTITSFNSSMIKLKDCSAEKLFHANLWEIFPDWKALNFYAEFKRSFKENSTVHFEEFSIQLNKWFDVTAYPYENSLTVFIKDISELKTQQLTLSLEKEVLEMSASSHYTLKEIIDHLLKGFESIHHGLKVSLSLSNKQGSHLYPFSIPSMPIVFEQAGMGLEIALLNHPCSQAAYYQKEIIIPDLDNTTNFKDFKALFQQYHLQTCHSLPILSENKKVLGTLAIFKVNRRQAIKNENTLIYRLGTITRVILENYQSKENIHLSNERYRLTTATTKDAVWDWDLLNQELYYGEGFKDYFNHNETLEANGIEKWKANLHPDDAQRVIHSLEKLINSARSNKWQEEYRYKKANGTYALVIDRGYIIRDEKRQAIRMVGAMQDITAEKKAKQEILEQNRKLREIAHISSHEIRKPAANILGLVNLFDKQNPANKLNAEIIEHLQDTAHQLDQVIHKIVHKTREEM